MKKWMLYLLGICLVVSVPACSTHDNVNEPATSQSQASVIENPSTSSESTNNESDSNDIEVVRNILHNYLDDCWGYGKHSHELIYDAIIEFDGIEFYSFKVYSIAGEYSSTFAIAVDEKLVYFYDEQTDEWVEDANPEPWPGW